MNEPLTQVDHGQDQSQGHTSSQSNLTLKVDGGGLAIGLSLLALGGMVVLAILLPDLIDSRSQSSSAYARQSAQFAEREARVAIEQVDAMRVALAEKGVIIPRKETGESK